ncbi:MAG: hypothetical protein QM820_25285 [Minicystis sp.]
MSRRVARSAPASIFAALVLAASALATAFPAGCAGEVPCELNSDCPVGYCQDGVCRKNCVDSERDCPMGYVCNANAQCEPASSGSSSSAGGAGGSPSSSSTGGAGPTSSSTGGSVVSSSSTTVSSSSSSGGTGKHELDLCFGDGECAAPLLCRAMFPGGSKRCTRTCASTGQCMTGTVCEQIGSEQYCAGDDTGRQCTAASTCNFGCLISRYCTNRCISGADCPNGFGCMDINGTSVCVKVAEPCSSGDAAGCIAPAACDESPEMYVGGCTIVCNSASDCPQRAAGLPAWTCDSGGICRRPYDVVGPLNGGWTPTQYVNNCQGASVNVCNDNQHIDFNAFNIPNPPATTCGASTTSDGIPTDSCVDSCRYQGGCAFGFACVAVGGINNARIGLCLPTGGGEVGATCQHDSQCVFGYCSNNKCSRDCTADGICPGGTTCTPGGGPLVEGQPFRKCL